MAATGNHPSSQEAREGNKLDKDLSETANTNQHQSHEHEEINQAASQEGTDAKEKRNYMTEWQARRKHFLILSEHGLPIFSRYEDEEENQANIAGYIKGLLSKTESIGDEFRFMDCGNVRFVILRENNLIFACITRTGETVTSLCRQLKALNGVIVCTVSAAPFQDSTLLAVGDDLVIAERPLRYCIRALNRTPSFMCNSVPILPVPTTTRQLAKDCLSPCEGSKQLLWGALVAGNELISFRRGNARAESLVHAFDLLTVVTFIQSQSTIYAGNATLPCWFPCQNPFDNVHAFVGYLGSLPRHAGRTSVPTSIRKQSQQGDSDEASSRTTGQEMVSPKGNSPVNGADGGDNESRRRNPHPHLKSMRPHAIKKHEKSISSATNRDALHCIEDAENEISLIAKKEQCVP
eukprot:gb/GECG01014391.1/.p1 GENE.gb/GECG01014391.1/~~gb/GECG01014391.1/.p1  ORF type:complete len:407 (+),score=35.19 gb/GECG01014391.1/:1-1221(+)